VVQNGFSMRGKTSFCCSMVTGMAWAKNPMLPRLKDLHAEGKEYNLKTGTVLFRDGSHGDNFESLEKTLSAVESQSGVSF
jgi:hypothetical protein